MKKTGVNRRNFIKVMTGGSSIILIPSVLGACNSGDSKIWLEGWNGPMADETDIRWIVLSYAILAANPHNTQPWIVDLTGPGSLDLYVDQQRLLPETDPLARQIHISQGTFLENLKLAAQQYGYRTNIIYFPKGEYVNAVVEDRPVASVTLSPDASEIKDPLYDVILRRQSNKRGYTEMPLSADQLVRLRTFQTDPRLQLTISDDASVRNELSEIMIDQNIFRCPDCRIALWSNYSGAGDKVHFVRVGTLDEAHRLPPDIHIFTASKQPWIVIPDGQPAFKEYYEREKYWPEESLTRRKQVLGLPN